MGSFSELYISDYPVFSIKNSYYQDVVNLIFLKSDYHEFERPLNERNKITWGDAYSNEKEIELVKSFYSTAKICLERLELFGVSYKKAKLDFEHALQKIREDDLYVFTSDKKISFELYLSKIKSIIESKEKRYENNYNDFDDYLHENELFIEYQSIELGLWSILSVVDSDSKIEYNLTNIIEGGWISEKPKQLINTEKIIVLTEGKIDTEFLKICINYFFPHLDGYYHFMDFENSRYEANASRLVHTIKSFVGSGIKNLIIALFDNDSAAKKEIKNLKKVKLPDNIKVLQYPEIEWAKNYPTIGPTGIESMDINGLAGSIEMYLGQDCLIENGEFIPIQWTGYMDSIDKYQGVILKKEEIQKLFRKKAKEFDKSSFNINNWKELISIIELINNAWK
ncbi:MAG: hypothetical protein HN704_04905 [Bacteroidetes bacterium]|jgi:hypothetical protein|nr:hypothetical protein [Bacteroidota bacterium]MBT7143544.1 hypothetical protein [Bacteroidota bacterium]MBT7490931.1 hypothetical protein [Bacteroidota bacterium]